jgi:hypothetical protein
VSQLSFPGPYAAGISGLKEAGVSDENANVSPMSTTAECPSPFPGLRLETMLGIRSE